MMVLAGIPAKENHKAPRKSLAGDGSRCHGKTLVGTPARPLSGPRQGPCQGHPRDHHRTRTSHASTTVRMQLPTQPAGQAPAWRHADPRGDPPLHHLSYLPAYMASQAPLARARVDAEESGDE